MYLKPNTVKLTVILLCLLFAAGLFFTVKFLRKQITTATSPSQDVVSNAEVNIDTATLNKVLEKIK